MLKQLWPLVLGSVALGLDAYVIAGLLSQIANDLGTSDSVIGLGVTTFTGAYAISGPLFSGRAGKDPRSGLLGAVAVFSLANVVTAVSPTVSVFLVSRLIAGAAAGIYSPLSSAVAGMSVPAKYRGRALSMVLAGLAVGTVVGVPVGLGVAKQLGWRATIALVSAIGIVALAGLALRKASVVPAPSSSLGQRLRVIGRVDNFLTTLVTFFVGVGSLGLYTYIPVVLDRVQVDTIAGMWVWGIGGAVGAFGIGRVLDKVNSSRKLTVIIIALLVIDFALLLLFPSSHVVAVVCLFAWGLLGWSSMAPQQHSMLSVNPDEGATAVAANASANYLGSAVGSAVGGLLLPSSTGILLGALGAVLVGIVCSIGASASSRSHSGGNVN
ncbi:MFS transporter [Corynebacterium kefirresidentii]|uniref:MFS transporter n=1 Tax=Corynebacterium kefirresidentii TaxID=1979527 RepID=A0ABT8Q5P5_9CORY|nr:MFS transporter [Corynebacterium kefirresidentii]MDN8620593.1 MFS transporter [Corynebacterium kefirresidentii]MDN8641950.1 MFS transporter [Corynebacterium kefirresidentii]